MWVLNTGKTALDAYIADETRWQVFKPGVPVKLDVHTGLKMKEKYSVLQECRNPEQYFVDNPLKKLIVRDAGIGDLILLEPIIRAYKKSCNTNITVVTRFPDVYLNNPNIDRLVEAKNKSDLSGINTKDFDDWVDLRCYSETAPRRDREHRTDIYNEKFKLNIVNKEPKLYFADKEKMPLKKNPKFRYVGIAVDASHTYREYPFINELVAKLLEDEKNIAVIFGEGKKYEFKKNKRIIDLQGKTTIRQMMNYVRGLDSLISVDSGIMHVGLVCHIPTVCIFTIITPDLRLRYYTGPYKVITKGVDCIGCGDRHMIKCGRHQSETGICMKIDPVEIVDGLNELMAGNTDVKKSTKRFNANIIPHSVKKLTMPIIVQDEEKNLPRFIENVINHPCIGRVIAIDGGSKDKTVELLKKAGAEVYVHPYIKSYHEQQAMQRNISCSYVKEGENILIMDIDECFSQDLSEYLPELANMEHQYYGLISRRTFNYYKDITDYTKSIKDYPDYQPRFYKWQRHFKFVGGAHHVTLNCPEPFKINRDILHFEKENGKRDKIEKQWAGMMKEVRKYA